MWWNEPNKWKEWDKAWNMFNPNQPNPRKDNK